jgi:hypothetical protein
MNPSGRRGGCVAARGAGVSTIKEEFHANGATILRRHQLALVVEDVKK